MFCQTSCAVQLIMTFVGGVNYDVHAEEDAAFDTSVSQLSEATRRERGRGQLISIVSERSRASLQVRQQPRAKLVCAVRACFPASGLMPTGMPAVC